MGASLNTPFGTARKEIRDDIIELVEYQMQEGEGRILDWIEDYHYGRKFERRNLRQRLPFLWIVPQSWQPSRESVQGEQHEMGHVFSVLHGEEDLDDHDEETMEELTENRLGAVYRVVDESRHLGGSVNDSWPGRVEPAIDFPEMDRTWWAGFEWIYVRRIYRRDG